MSGLSQPILSSFVLNKPSGFKIICEPETIPNKKNKEICFENYNFLSRR